MGCTLTYKHLNGASHNHSQLVTTAIRHTVPRRYSNATTELVACTDKKKKMNRNYRGTICATPQKEKTAVFKEKFDYENGTTQRIQVKMHFTILVKIPAHF